MCSSNGIWKISNFSARSLYSRLPHQSQQQLCFGCLPLNAIISDQIENLESRGIGVKVFKQGYQGVVTTIDDDVKFIYGHAEVFAENDSVKRLLRSPFKDRIKAIVIDEAHFIIQW